MNNTIIINNVCIKLTIESIVTYLGSKYPFNNKHVNVEKEINTKVANMCLNFVNA